MTVTVIRLDKREDKEFTQYCIVNTEMNMREFRAYCQIYNVYRNAEKTFRPTLSAIQRGVRKPKLQNSLNDGRPLKIFTQPTTQLLTN